MGLGKLQKYEKIVELSTWAVMIAIIFGIRFLPDKVINNSTAYLLVGAIVAFALLYYLVIHKYFSKNNRLYLKSIADIVLVSVLIHILKDQGDFFYALYFLPIAAAALSLEFINALLIAMIASLFVVFEIFLGAQGVLPQTQSNLYAGFWQIGFILFITIFCRFLAVQLRQEQRQKEESLNRQKMLEAQAKEEKEFLSLTSHQLYTPLSIIRGFASMLNDGSLGELKPKQAEAAREIHASSKRMASLVGELLSISRIESGTFEIKKALLDVGSLVKNSAELLNRTKTNEDVRIEVQIPPEVNSIQADEEKIRQVIYNLIDNAIKYTKKGAIKIALQQTPDQTKISVEDEGIGLDKEDFGKLFQPFFRGKNILELDNKGTGLGLYIARLIIEKHGGKIEAANNQNKGSTFSFTLPNN